MTELRRRVTADLQLAGYSKKTQQSYLWLSRQAPGIPAFQVG
jgi:hypothetical protein